MRYNFFDILDAAADHDPETDNLVNYYPEEVVAAAYYVMMMMRFSLFSSLYRKWTGLVAHFTSYFGKSASNVAFDQLEFVSPDYKVGVGFLYVLDRIGVATTKARVRYYNSMGVFPVPVAERLLAAQDTLEEFAESYAADKYIIAKDLLNNWIKSCEAWVEPLRGTYRHGERVLAKFFRQLSASDIRMRSAMGLRNLSDLILQHLFDDFYYPNDSSKPLKLDQTGQVVVADNLSSGDLGFIPIDRPIRLGSGSVLRSVLHAAATVSPDIIYREKPEQPLFAIAWNTFRVVEAANAWDHEELPDAIDHLNQLFARFGVKNDVSSLMVAARMGESWARAYKGTSRAHAYSNLYKIV